MDMNTPATVAPGGVARTKGLLTRIDFKWKSCARATPETTTAANSANLSRDVALPDVLRACDVGCRVGAGTHYAARRRAVQRRPCVQQGPREIPGVDREVLRQAGQFRLAQEQRAGS